MNVVILEPAPQDNHWFHTNVRTPHLGPPILAGILNRRGHRAAVLSELVGPIDYRLVADADLVGISLNTSLTHQIGYEMAARVRRLRPDVPLVAGGHHASLNPREALGHVDYVVRGYAEESFPALVEALGRGETAPTIPGVSYAHPDTGRVIHTPDAGATDISHLPDLDAIVGYRRRVAAARWGPDAYGTFLPLSFYSRGCAFSCHFCSIPLADGKRMSCRSADRVADDIRSQLAFYRFPYSRPRVWLIDDNFGQHAPDTKTFLAGLIAARLPCRFVVQARVEIGRDPELLGLMARAGFTTIYLGVESVSDESLAVMNKRSGTDKIAAAVRAIRTARMDVVALLMFGNDGDRRGVAGRTARYLESLGVRHVNPQVAVPYPGTEYHRRLAAEGRVFTTDYRACNLRPIHFPTTIRPSQVVKEICEITARFLSRGRVVRGLVRGDFLTWCTRRGVIGAGYLRRVAAGARALEEFEDPYYDADDRLRQDKLRRDMESGEVQARWARFHSGGPRASLNYTQGRVVTTGS